MHDLKTCPHCGQALPTPPPPKGRPPKAREAREAQILARFDGVPFTAAQVCRELSTGPAEVKRALESLEGQGRARRTGEVVRVGASSRAAVWMIVAAPSSGEAT